MIRIVQENIWSSLYPDIPEEVDLVSEILSVKVEDAWRTTAYKKRTWDGKYRFLHLPNNLFLSGLTPRLTSELTRLGIPFQVIDRRMYAVPDETVEVKDDMLHGVTLRPDQMECLKKVLAGRRGIIDAAVNAGKTELAIATAHKVGGNALFLFSRVMLVDQTANRIKERLPGMEVGVIHEATFTPMKWTVASIQSVVPKLDNAAMVDYLHAIDFVYVDEVHHLPAKSWNSVLCQIPGGWRLGGSAEPLSGNSVRDWTLVGHTGEVLDEITDKELTDLGVSAEAFIFIVPYADEDIEKGDFSFVYDVGVVKDVKRNTKIVDMIVGFVEAGLPGITFVSRTEHGETLSRMCMERGLHVPFLEGSTPLEERWDWCNRFSTGEISAMIATNIFDEGLDIPQIRSMVLAGGGKGGSAGIGLVQRIGRGKRRKATGRNALYVVDLFDTTSLRLAKHLDKRLDLFIAKGWKVQVCDNPVSKAVELERGNEEAKNASDGASQEGASDTGVDSAV